MIGRKSLCMAVLSLVVLTAAPAYAQKIVHLHDTVHRASWTNWLNIAKAEFEALHPGVEVEIIGVIRAEQVDKIAVMYASGILPDVIEVFPATHYQFVQRGFFLPLNQFVENDPDVSWDKFYPPAVEAARIAPDDPNGGDFWMLPTSVWTLIYAFNHDRFLPLGVEVPSSWDRHWTWDDLLDIGKKLTRYGPDGSVTQYAIEINSTNDRTLVWLHNGGGWPFDRYVDPTASRLNDPATRRAVEFLEDVWQHSRIARGGNYASAPMAITLAGPDYTSGHQRAGSTHTWSFGLNPRNVAGGSENVTVGFALSPQSEHLDIAWEWIKFLATGPGATEHINVTGRPVPWQPLADAWMEQFDRPTGWEHLFLVAIASPESYERPVIPNELHQIYQDAIRQVYMGTAPAAVALEQAHDRAQAFFRQQAQGS